MNCSLPGRGRTRTCSVNRAPHSCPVALTVQVKKAAPRWSGFFYPLFLLYFCSSFAPLFSLFALCSQLVGKRLYRENSTNFRYFLVSVAFHDGKQFVHRLLQSIQTWIDRLSFEHVASCCEKLQRLFSAQVSKIIPTSGYGQPGGRGVSPPPYSPKLGGAPPSPVGRFIVFLLRSPCALCVRL